ncbi:fructose-1-6-bisphosphatase-domain-containing protein [Xylaria bambusicola]|uniref:fructose-1-6-bisphosphatase-domain-containing protein n=1 Tax=Xylaria bambusicola TaxID=326684 RepID=UPI0020076D90|nr:fructose-1-6-bisphosphatase-domain-containing protein [Xylaria bambusicola]KAI0526176.1 fructose-1-6-bisphosphatase-domain-containing protein [Xylaria bambusicola]
MVPDNPIRHHLKANKSYSFITSASYNGHNPMKNSVIARSHLHVVCPESYYHSTACSEYHWRLHGNTVTQQDASIASEHYTLTFDPLDGSSIIAPNWTVGTIIGIWDGPGALNQSPKKSQVAAILGIYGPRTMAVIAIRVPNVSSFCFEVGLNPDGGGVDTPASVFEILRSDMTLLSPPFKTRYFAPANLRAAAEDANYMRLVASFIQHKYTLRYSGGLVPDIYHILVNGQGVYISPVTPASKAKLCPQYELSPIALVIECCAGQAVDPTTESNILDDAIKHCDERTGLLCGTKEEVEGVVEAMINLS